MERLSNDQEDHPNHHKNSHKLCNETGHPIVNLMETETITWSEFPIGGKAIVEQILASEERNKSRRVGVWESQSEIYIGKLTIWVRSFEIITKFTRSISSTKIGKPVLMMDIKISKEKNISRWVDWENLIYVRWNRIKNGAQRWRRWLIEKKEVRHWVK